MRGVGRVLFSATRTGPQRHSSSIISAHAPMAAPRRGAPPTHKRRSSRVDLLTPTQDDPTPSSSLSDASSVAFAEARSHISHTLQKPLIPRTASALSTHAPRASTSPSSSLSSSSSSAAAHASSAMHDEFSQGYDPVAITHVNSRTKRVHLHAGQNAVLWAARQGEYHDLLHRVVACLHAHQRPVEKAYTLLALHEEVVAKRLRLRADTYDDIFHHMCAVSTMCSASQLAMMDAAEGEDGGMPSMELMVSGAMPADFSSPRAVAEAFVGTHVMEKVWSMYRYMVDSGTNPTASTLQSIMGLLDHGVRMARSPSSSTTTTAPRTSGRSSAICMMEAKAHSLMMDADRFRLRPTTFTINSYIGVCDGAHVMHMAVARTTDFFSRHESQPNPGIYARLISGLLHNGHHEEAMSVVSTMQSVAMSAHLLNAVLQAARMSRDPSSVFAFYTSVVGSSPTSSSTWRKRAVVRPSIHTISILLEVAVRMQNEEESTRKLHFVIGEMKRHGIKGSALVLNKLLRGLLASKREAEASMLMRAMDEKHIRVFDELRHAVEGNTNVVSLL